MACVGNEQRSFCHFWDCTQVLHFRLFRCWLWGLFNSSKGFFPTVVNIMVIWIKCSLLVYFSSLIPKMSVFTLAISCLTTSNLPWFMDLTFQVSMQHFYADWCHQSSLPSPVTPTLGIVFALAQPFILSGVISPLFSRSILGTYRPGEFIFQCPIFLPFHTVHWVLKARRLKWFSISFSSGPYFVFMELAILKHHINRSIQFVPLHVGLLWLSIVFSRYIHIVACGRMTFFFVAE